MTKLNHWALHEVGIGSSDPKQVAKIKHSFSPTATVTAVKPCLAEASEAFFSFSELVTVQPAQLCGCPLLPKQLISQTSTSSENISPHCLWPPCVNAFIPGCPQCRAAAAVWQFLCALSSGRGRRARSSCCLRRDAAAGSSALQQTPCAPGRHGKNWSWMPLRGEKGKDERNTGKDKQREHSKALCTVFVRGVCTHIVYEVINMNAKKN